MNVFVLVILFYLLYRFIGSFLLPLYRSSRQMRQRFHDMSGKPPGGDQQGNPTTPGGNGTSAPADPPKSSTTKGGEYIDFEEVR